MSTRHVVDVDYSDERSVHLIKPLTKRAQDWFTEHIPDSAQRSGDATVVEHRYIDMVAGGYGSRRFGSLQGRLALGVGRRGGGAGVRASAKMKSWEQGEGSRCSMTTVEKIADGRKRRSSKALAEFKTPEPLEAKVRVTAEGGTLEETGTYLDFPEMGELPAAIRRRMLLKLVATELGFLQKETDEEIMAMLTKTDRASVGAYRAARITKQTARIEPELLEALGVSKEDIEASTVVTGTRLSLEALASRGVDPETIEAATVRNTSVYLDVRRSSPGRRAAQPQKASNRRAS